MGTSAAKCLSLLLAAPIHLRSALRGRAGLPPLCTFCSPQLRLEAAPRLRFRVRLSRPQSRRSLYGETTQLPLLCSLQLSDICLLIFVWLFRTAAGKRFPPAVGRTGWFGWKGRVDPPQKALRTPQPPAPLPLCAPLSCCCIAVMLRALAAGGPTAAAGFCPLFPRVVRQQRLN